MRAKTEGASKRGGHHQSTDASRLMRAIVRQSPMTP
jgi:hypothetical protein